MNREEENKLARLAKGLMYHFDYTRDESVWYEARNYTQTIVDLLNNGLSAEDLKYVLNRLVHEFDNYGINDLRRCPDCNELLDEEWSGYDKETGCYNKFVVRCNHCSFYKEIK